MVVVLGGVGLAGVVRGFVEVLGGFIGVVILGLFLG